MQYASQYNDNESNLYWMRARYYDPTTAQFITRDPIESQTCAAYVNGNPLNMTDPSGLLFGRTSSITDTFGGGPRAVAQWLGRQIDTAISEMTEPVYRAGNIGLGSFDFGTGTAGLFNVIYGSSMMYRGAVAIAAGEVVSLGVITVPVGTALSAYGAYSMAGGATKFYRGNDQIFQCASEGIADSKQQTLAKNFGRFTSGITPNFTHGWIHGSGGLAW